MILEFLNALASLVSVALYVLLTYSEYPGVEPTPADSERIRLIDSVQDYINLFFLLDFVLRLCMCSLPSFLEHVIMLSVIWSRKPKC